MKRTLLFLSTLILVTACSSNGGSGSSTVHTATSTFAFLGSTAVPVSDCPAVTGQTDSWCRSNWPPGDSGTVYNYSFTETRLTDGTQLPRNAYVYKPAQITAGAVYPLLTYLHGGTQSGDQLFSLLPFAQLADGRTDSSPAGWSQNTATCQQSALGSSAYGLGGTTESGFVSTDGSGSDCIPASQNYSRPTTAPPFYVVYPNGVESFDGDGRNWEDGRTPSTGFYNAPNPDAEHRDDVAFINTLIATIKGQEGALVDSTRVYIGGISNGGIMTTRLMCNMSNPNFPELDNVAAFSVSVASMAENIRTGSAGRELCASSGPSPTPLSIIVGYDSPTPNSAGQPFFDNCNPYNPSDPAFPNMPACPYATVSGDGTIPYGTAFDVGGGSYTVNSPTIGDVIASFDNQNFWLDYLQLSGGGSANLSSGTFGYFTHYRHYSFANSPAIYQVYETQAGLHLNGGSRFDVSVGARIYDFLFSFQKVNGVPVYIGGAYVPASGIYSNLNGTY